MRIGNLIVKRRVWVAAGSFLVVTVAWWAWTRVTPPVPVTAQRPSAPFVRLASVGSGRTDEILREQAELFDPTPLFFPTEWNYGQRALPVSIGREPEQVFPNFEAKLVFTEPNMKPYGVGPSTAPATLPDVLVQGNEAPLAGFGQIDTPREPLSERSAFLEVRSVGSAKIVIGQAFKGLTVPRPDFAPLEFLVVVSSAGVVGEPLLTSGSGWDEVDAFFRSYLVKTYRLGERLIPGNYRVIVGP